MDPFEQDYLTYIDEEEDLRYMPDQWEFSTLSYNAGDTLLPTRQIIDGKGIDEWVDKVVETPAVVPGIDILSLSHKDIGRRDVKWDWLPLRAQHFKDVLRKLGISAQYFHLRGVGGSQCGGSSYTTRRDSTGTITHINWIIRSGHASTFQGFTAFWCMAATYNFRTGRTLALVEQFTAQDLAQVSAHLLASQSHIVHPLFFPEMMLHMVIKGVNDKVRIPEELAFFLEERRTGLSRMNLSKADEREMRKRGWKGKTIWEWGDCEFREATTKVNRFKTTVAYCERRFGFSKQLAVRLLEVLEEISAYEDDMVGGKPQGSAGCGSGTMREGGKDVRARVRALKWSYRERLKNRQLLLENYEMQMHCMQKRTENLITVLYTVLSQIDTKNQVAMAQTNLQIAQAVRSDSIPMRTVAYVTLIFLPGAFIATIFGTNFFALDPKTLTFVTAPTFWHFWATSVPLTIFVLLVWNYWVYWERKEAESVAKVARTVSSLSAVRERGREGDGSGLDNMGEGRRRLGWLMRRVGLSEGSGGEVVEGRKVEV